MEHVDSALPPQTSDSGFTLDHCYHIRVKGKLDEGWSDWFNGLTITHAEALSETLLSGNVPDQAALHGLLAKIRDLNLELISVERRPA